MYNTLMKVRFKPIGSFYLISIEINMYASMNNLVFISQTSDLRNKTSRVEIVTGKI